MLQKGYLVWGTLVCLGLMFAQVAGLQTPRLDLGSGTSGFGSSSRGSGGFSGFGGGK